jgi:superfamily II DNA or RNA helicase
MSTATQRSQARVNSFHQRLGQLTYHQACQLLGEQGKELLAVGSGRLDVDPDDVYLGGDLFRVRMTDHELLTQRAIVTLTLQGGRSRELRFNCDQCDTACQHLGAAFAYLLDAKSVMGLAAPPDPSVPLENLTDEELRRRALADRAERAREEAMTVRSMDTTRPWADYLVTSHRSGKTYRVALRGEGAGQSYCSCPDFRTNRLGTCKHIMHSFDKVQSRFSGAKLRSPYVRKNVSLRVDYGSPRGLRFNLPTRAEDRLQEIVSPYAEQTLIDVHEAMRRIASIENLGWDVHVYPDAEELIQTRLVQDRLRQEADKVRCDVESHPLRRGLLKTELLPYQLDGIAFAVGAGRAVLADDMGLGKTIQGIGVAELLAQWAEIQRVLVVCPASLKSQWRNEIARFSDRSAQLVIGGATMRADQYASAHFFTICNYEQVLRDLTAVEAVAWDLIILDEGQRIKNWESKTSQVIRSLNSTFRLVLSGTPLENHLGELFTVTQFVDESLLGPAHQFFHKHRVVDDHGKLVGYHRLDELRESLRPVLLRRTRGQVARQLPERTDELVRIRPTAEQLEIHDAQIRIVAQIVQKKFFTEMDLLRLRRALAIARMSADSTFLVDQTEPEFSSKLDRLAELLGDLGEDPANKIVIFSEWRRMLDRIELILERHELDYVRLDGQVPQKQRPPIVSRFQNDSECRVILMTNAGSTGLNLQSANVVINVDLPWNPAVLEQRIARAHRMGQQNPVHVYKLVTENTIEEKLLDALDAKQNLADASLDVDSQLSAVTVGSGMCELKQRLEKLITPTDLAPVDESQRMRVEAEALQIAERRERVSAASGELVGAALRMVGELVGGSSSPAPAPEKVEALHQNLAACIERDEVGRPHLRISLPDDNALRSLAESLARLLS